MEPESNLILTVKRNNFKNLALFKIIIAITLTSPNQTMTKLLTDRPPFCVRLKREDIFNLQCKLCVPIIKFESLPIVKSRFLKSQSHQDNFDESLSPNLKILLIPALYAVHLYVNNKNITFTGKTEPFILLDSLNKNLASSLERIKSKSLEDIFNIHANLVLKIKFYNSENKRTKTKILCDGYGSVKDTNANAYISFAKYKMITMLFFREMSDNHNSYVPMEVEEDGLDAYMSDYQRMLDRLDSPSEVSGEGVGSCAGEVLVERGPDAMGKDGGIEDGKAKPVPGSTFTCPEPRSDIESVQGVDFNLSRDERGSVNENEVIENIVVAEDAIPRYAVLPYLRLADYLNKNVINVIKRAWQVPPRVAKPLTPLVAPRSGLVQTQGGGKAVTKLVPKVNLSAPNFFGDRRSGYAINLEGFSCQSSYTCTFDIARDCRICPNEHEAFSSNLMGTLVVGDSYTPCIIGGGGKCVPVFRQHNAGFREITYSLKFLLKYRKSSVTGKPCSRPNLIIVSLPGHLQAVGPDQYLKEFNIFKGWIQHFLQTGRDYDSADARIHSPCTTSVQVFEGFAPFIQGDRGISESYAVLARSFEILSAVEPTMNPGLFYKAFENTMVKFGSDSNKSEMVRYVAVDPVKPEFEVYEDRTVYTGLPKALLGSENVVDPEVGVFFMQELVSMVRVLISKGVKGSFLDSLPLPAEIESAIPTGPDGRLTSPEDDENLNVLTSSNTRVVVVGNSNLKLISEELNKTIKDTVVYVKYPFNIFANSNEISAFIDSLELKKADVLVLGGQGNSLLQGMLTPKFKKHLPSGVPAGFSTFGAGRSKIFHALNVASYDPEYLDNFGVFIEKIMGFVNQTGARTVFIPPFPRYPTVCCTQSGHFCAGYDGNLFNAEVVRLGTYISRLESLKDAFVLTSEDICHRDDWVSRGKMLKDDRVHLTDKGVAVVRSLIQKCHHFWTVMDMPKPTLGPSVPSGISFSRWVEAHREHCGFEDLKPSGAFKRSQPPMSYQKKAKR